MRFLVLALVVAAAAADARKSAPRRQAVQASPSGLSGGGPVVRGGSPLPPMAMILPADNMPLMVVEEGAVNFLSLYGGVLTLRILLSWFPQAQGVALLKPIFTVSDVYLNLFRGVIPSIGGPVLCRKHGGSAVGRLARLRPLSAPDPASGCPRLRPGSANQPLARLSP